MRGVIALFTSDRAFRTKTFLRGGRVDVRRPALRALRTRDGRKDLEHEAGTRAREAVQKDLAYRLWVTHRGGVYVPIDADTPPNPNLSHMPDRDVTINGRPFTLVNPAYMTRMVRSLEPGSSASGHT